VSNPYIEVMECRKKHYIFTGRNALWQALFYDKYGRVATPDELYRARFRVKNCCSWGIDGAKTRNHVEGTEVLGNGVHAKVYDLGGSVIYSSQNNGSSQLFEFAILYKGVGSKMEAVSNFSKRTIGRAKDFSRWWKSTGKIFGGGK